MEREVTIWYLEMRDPGDLRWPERRNRAFEVRKAEIPCPAVDRFFYMTCGAEYHWYERRPWSEEQWRAYVDRPELETWIAYLKGTPCGYFTLERQQEGNIELKNLGLLPDFLGQGLGGLLLAEAVARAWQKGASRVWVHTCSLDHPGALPNYLARGFRVYRTETVRKHIPPAAAGEPQG